MNSLYFIFNPAVLTLKQGLMKFQLSQLMWTVASILLVVGQCKFLATCVLTGMFWFFFPMATVIMNDVSAYICGLSMGKKFIKVPFLALSPNKTWEGFIGGGLLTMLFSFFFPVLLSQFTWFTCPAEELSFIPPAVPALSCEVNPVFLQRDYEIPLHLLRGLFANASSVTVTLLPIQLHGLMYGLFASIVAPFGGFMASAIKRAYNIKDFDTLFPGHGGMMDRMDCQLLMLLFTWVHMFTFVVPRVPTIHNLLLSASLLSLEDQIQLHQELGEQIQGVLTSAAVGV
ncbi:cdsA [Symbiodinium microadriaticum]|nr:cdsA [Symbiodinium microadriaticum]